MNEKIIARLAPSPARRILAAGTTGGLGVVMVWLLAAHPAPSTALLAGLGALAILSFTGAFLVWRATALGLELTREELRDTSGRQLFALEDVAEIEKGLLAWKPAGGFAVVLREAKPRVWVPGLWWRVGRRVMIGGATNGGEAKAMADLMRAEIDRRNR